MTLAVLALEPYHGGSHRAFLEGWSSRSRHRWTLLALPARKWKWRMRHAAVTFAERVPEARTFDLVLCSDMLNLAEFKGLAPEPVRALPAVAYFHENQLTYPFRHQQERDHHYGFINMTTALAARAVWFNSAFHRDAFLDELARVLRRMPDHRPLDAVERIRARSRVEHPPIDPPAPRPLRAPGPLHVAWAARWEHDKDPDTFFEALDLLDRRGVPFRLSVLGERFRDAPPVFEEARRRLAPHVVRFGWLPSRDDYFAALAEADVFVSTARHEFFGLAAAEAVAAGALPLLPDRLAYPELLSAVGAPDPPRHLFDGGAPALADRLADLAGRLAGGALPDGSALARGAARLFFERRVPELDDALDAVATAGRM